MAEEPDKVSDSLEKGNKSYYYWSQNLGHDQINLQNPQLLNKEVVQEKPVLRPQVNIEKYAWLEEKSVVKIYIELPDIGTHDKEKIVSNFTEESFEFHIYDYKGTDYHLGLPKLYDKIRPQESKHRVLAQKVILTLQKNREKTWGVLRAPVRA
eukprot:TRINITY_DN4251_c0_g1_i2.p1 TRINITY_DN4251_c0_g1~~TRINITY_DN4251_c0_g1_i2.p1  ORF type:complete len:174 (+),score=45.02 TRINITY_DN4251_c0_g1_i2:66-524(+)